jgi:hypothetical protein
MIFDSIDRRLEICRFLVGIRDIAGQALGFEVFPNPVWDMLLDLYLAHHEHREVYLWPLCIASHCPLSTAHRKVAFMERRGLVARSNHGRDRRRINVAMTDKGAETMDVILDRITARILDLCPKNQA